MFYTVVKKSGWHTDKNWCIVKTFTSKAKANEFASNNKASDPRSDWYNTAVIAHRKPVSEYAHDDAYRIGGKTYIR